MLIGYAYDVTKDMLMMSPADNPCQTSFYEYPHIQTSNIKWPPVEVHVGGMSC